MNSLPLQFNGRWLLLTGLGALFLLTRVPALTHLPITSDEATFIHWGQIIGQDPSKLLIAQTEGRQPLFSWLVALMLNVSAEPLWAGRMVSVLAGLAAMLGLFRVGRELFSQVVGGYAALVYIFCPYTWYFDRMALPDAVLTALGVWILRFALGIALETGSSVRNYRVLGILLALAGLTRAGGLFLLVFPAAVMTLWGVHRRPHFFRRMGMALALAGIPLFLAIALGPELVFPGRVRFWHLPSDFISPTVLAGFPFNLWYRNAMTLREYYLPYLMLPMILLLFAALVLTWVTGDRRQGVLWIGAVGTVVLTLLGANRMESNQFMMFLPPLILLTGWTVHVLSEQLMRTLRDWGWVRWHGEPGVCLVAAGFFLVPVLFNGWVFQRVVIQDPNTVLLPVSDRSRFVTGPGAGYGIEEAAAFIQKEAAEIKRRKGLNLFLLIPAQPGNPADGIAVYTFNDLNVTRVPAFWWPENPTLLPTRNRFSLRPSIYQPYPALRRETHLLDQAYFILPPTYPGEKFLAENPRFEKVWSFPKAVPGLSVDIYQKTS